MGCKTPAWYIIPAVGGYPMQSHRIWLGFAFQVTMAVIKLVLESIDVIQEDRCFPFDTGVWITQEILLQSGISSHLLV